MDHLIALALVTLLLVAIPGPNVALIVATALAHGIGQGLATVAGTTAGVGLQLAAVVLGLGTLLTLAAGLLVWLKWLGVAYLVWLGLRHWFAGDPETEAPAAPGRRRAAGRAFRRGLLVALLNPKTLVFNAAFLPQFVPADADPATGLAFAAGLFLLVLTLGDALWVLFAGSLRPFVLRMSRLRQRLSGGLFLAAAAGLALARAER